MINLNIDYSNPKQAVLPLLISDYLDICDPVLTFDRFMGEIELEKYLKSIPKHYTGRLKMCIRDRWCSFSSLLLPVKL